METPETAPVENTRPAEGTSEAVTPEVAPKPAKPRKAKPPTTSPSIPEAPKDGVEVTPFGFVIETF